ncbi:MAG: ABC transporter permease subunit [Rhodobacteraceae bacterium]|nr:MAG: ABC transporter permease subunit [Paracoccaceae bacterium]
MGAVTHPFLRIVRARLGQAVMAAAVLATLCFGLIHALPGDAALRIAAARVGEGRLTPETVARIRAEAGLDRPLIVQYGAWMGRLARGDLGRSPVTRRPVAAELGSHARHTLALGLAGWLLSYAVALPLGLAAGLRPGGRLDRVTQAASVALASTPSFLIGIVLISILALSLRWLPPAGFRTSAHMVLPAATLALGLAANSVRVVRHAVVDVRGAFFVTYAQLRGLPEGAAFRRHGLRHAAVPVVTFMALQTGFVIDGFVVIETLFAYPGIGDLLVRSLLARDVPMAIRNDRLAVTPLKNATPETARDPARRLYGLPPRVRITDLIEEVGPRRDSRGPAALSPAPPRRGSVRPMAWSHMASRRHLLEHACGPPREGCSEFAHDFRPDMTPDDPAVAAALAAWRDALAPESVLSALEASHAYRRGTFPWDGRPLAVLRPRSADEAAACVAVAGAFGAPLHPVARGRSWGLGSRLPPQDAAILDLAGLDRVIALDMARGLARIEPGVTFAALQDRLKREGLAWHLPSFGGPPDASVLANALERGDGAGPGGDRFAALWDLDVALSTGERLRTGSARFGGAQASGATADLAIHPRPAGPTLEGLFSQSGFGVVLAATIALQPTPAFAEAMLFDLGPAPRLGPALAALAGLIRDGVVDPMGAALWDGAKRRASGAGGDGWGLSLALSGPDRGFLAARRRRALRALRPWAVEVLVEGDRDATGRRRETPLTGFSDGANLASLYAGRGRRPGDAGDPDADGCGFVWLCPVAPLEGAAVEALAAAVDAATAAAPVVAALGFQAQSARALHGYVSLAWDRAQPGADAAAMAAHDRLAERLIALGMPPFRRGWAGLAAQPIADPTARAVLARLRAALDPAGALSPGRTL